MRACEKREKKKWNGVTLLCILLLLILRFPILYMGEAGIMNQMAAMFLYICGTYFVTGIVICRNRMCLLEYNITVVSVLLYLFSPFLSFLIGQDDITTYIRIGMSFFFIFFLLKNRKTIEYTKNHQKNTISNILFVVLTITAVVLFGAWIRGFKGGSQDVFSVRMLMEGFIYQLTTAAVLEEPLFRGVLWGSFRKTGMNEILCCIMQAVLFWGGHIYYMDTGLNFWIFIPFVSIIIGVINIKTRSITYTMVSHAMINALGDIFQHCVKIF